MPDRQKKSRDCGVEKSHATSQSDPPREGAVKHGAGYSIRSEAPNAKLHGVEGQKHKREYEAKICDNPSQAIARRRYRGSMELVAEPDAHNTGTGCPLPGSRSTPETTVPLLCYPVWLLISNF